jgi:hypothetical protein
VSDVLERVREADPVDAAALEVPAELAVRALTRPPRTGWRRGVTVGGGTVALAAVVVALVVVLPGPGGGHRDPYAALASGGITHWRMDIINPGGARQRYEGWAAGGVTHEVAYDLVGGRARMVSESRTEPDGRSRVWTAVSGETRSEPPAAPGASQAAMIPSGDPAAAFRAAYRAGRLKRVDAVTFRIAYPPDFQVTYTVDPDSGVPRRLVVGAVGAADAGTGTTTVEIPVYEHLPATAANRAKLALGVHAVPRAPGTARELFAALRAPDAPPAARVAELGDLLMHMGDHHHAADAAAARAVGEGGDVWLMPNGGRVCIAVADAGGSGMGSSCLILGKVESRGVSVSDGVTTFVAVPDGVTGVSDGGRTFPVRAGLARVPGLSTTYRLIR